VHQSYYLSVKWKPGCKKSPEKALRKQWYHFIVRATTFVAFQNLTTHDSQLMTAGINIQKQIIQDLIY
jgi:hypothetical protein